MEYIIISDSIVKVDSTQKVSNYRELLDVLVETQCECLIISKNSISDEFFDLKNGIAGEILQKLTNYRKRMAIIGDYSNIESKALADFIYESNKMENFIFVETEEKALKIFTEN